MPSKRRGKSDTDTTVVQKNTNAGEPFKPLAHHQVKIKLPGNLQEKALPSLSPYPNTRDPGTQGTVLRPASLLNNTLPPKLRFPHSTPQALFGARELSLLPSSLGSRPCSFLLVLVDVLGEPLHPRLGHKRQLHVGLLRFAVTQERKEDIVPDLRTYRFVAPRGQEHPRKEDKTGGSTT